MYEIWIIIGIKRLMISTSKLGRHALPPYVPPISFKSRFDAFRYQTTNTLCEWGKLCVHYSKLLRHQGFCSWKANDLSVGVNIWQALSEHFFDVLDDATFFMRWDVVPFVANKQSAVWWKFHLLFSSQLPCLVKQSHELRKVQNTRLLKLCWEVIKED